MDYRDYTQDNHPFAPAPYAPQRPQQVWDVLPDTPAGQEVTVVSNAAYMARVQDLLRGGDAPADGTVVLSNEQQPMVWVPSAAGNFVAVLRDTLPAGYLHTTPLPGKQEPAPRSAIDPRAQVLAAGGIFAAGTGWGVGQILSSLAGLGGGALLALAVLLIAARMPSRQTRSGDTYITNTTHNHNRWFGKSTSHNG